MSTLSVDMRCFCGATQRVDGITMHGYVSQLIDHWNREHKRCRQVRTPSGNGVAKRQELTEDAPVELTP